MSEAPLSAKPLSAAHLRALARLDRLGPSRLRRWARASRRIDDRWLRSEIVHDLWFRRLVDFNWMTDRYTITDAGRDALAATAPDAPLRRIWRALPATRLPDDFEPDCTLPPAGHLPAYAPPERYA